MAFPSLINVIKIISTGMHRGHRPGLSLKGVVMLQLSTLGDVCTTWRPGPRFLFLCPLLIVHTIWGDHASTAVTMPSAQRTTLFFSPPNHLTCPSNIDPRLWSSRTVGKKINVFFCLFVFKTKFLCSPGYPGAHSVDMVGFKVRDLPPSASQVLALKECATTTTWPSVCCMLF